jgi:hypothetical protein
VSPSRRDILKLAGTAALAATLPTTVNAEPEHDFEDYDDDEPAKDVTIRSVMITGTVGESTFSIMQMGKSPVNVYTSFVSRNGKAYAWTHDYREPAVAEQVDEYARAILHVFCNADGWLGDALDV